jgi:hypothetical protein
MNLKSAKEFTADVADYSDKDGYELLSLSVISTGG